jgi:hypothetical protein
MRQITLRLYTLSLRMSMQKQINGAEQLKKLFAQKACWTMDELRRSLGYAAISIRRFLKRIGYFSSFTHNSKWYTLSDIPAFNNNGLWFCGQVGFSKHGNLKQTLLYFINHSSQGLSAKELEEKLSIPCHAVLNHLYKHNKTDRFKGKREFVYLSTDPVKNRRQMTSLLQHIEQSRQPEKGLSAQAAVYVLAEYIKNPQASYDELSRAVARKQVIAKPQAIARLFEQHDLKKTLN